MKMYKRKHLKVNVGRRQFYRRVSKENKNILSALQNSCNDCESVNSIMKNVQDQAENDDQDLLCTVDSNSQFSDIGLGLEPGICNHPETSEGSTHSPSYSFTFSQSLLIESKSSFNTATDLVSQLRNWAIERKVCHNSITGLLKILAPFHPQLPLDSRTLLKTPRRILIQKLDNGEYCHFGIENVLKNLIPSTCFDERLKLSINIDGLPLFSSTNLQFWPILGLVRNFDCVPFAIGIFCGKSKPIPLNLFLRDFIEEANHLRVTGINLHSRVYFVEILNFICDSPAKAYLKGIKSHGGYSSCDKCWESGVYYHSHRKVILKGTTSMLRTDEQFISQLDEGHHREKSPLLELNIGLVSSFTIDYMHAVCLGVMKKLLVTWISGGLHIRLRHLHIEKLSENMMFLRTFVPSEFNRKPRSLSEICNWKATEFRNFLLYFGPFVLAGNVDISVFEHFLLLHVGISILVSSKHLSSFGAKNAGIFLNAFVKHCEFIYGSEFYVYNTHILCHLDGEATQYGTLDSFSAFPFENFLGIIKSFVRSPLKPLQQIYRRLSERNFIYVKPPFELNHSVHGEHDNGPTIGELFAKQYKKITYRNVTFSSKSYSCADAYGMTKEGIVVEIHNICSTSDEKIFFIAKKFLPVYKSLYFYPIDSKDLNIYVVSSLSELQSFDISDLVSKCMVFPSKPNDSNYVCIPLLHTGF